MAKKVGRNAPCPCGSGKKYKKCCFAKDEAALAEKGSRPRDTLTDIDATDQENETANPEDAKNTKAGSPFRGEDSAADEELAALTSDKAPKDRLPKLTAAEDRLIDRWFETYKNLNDPDRINDHLWDFLGTYPQLAPHLEIDAEVLFEIGAGWIRQDRHDEYAVLLKRIRNEFPVEYFKSFGPFDRDLISHSVMNGRLDEIPLYLENFKAHPEDSPDYLFETIDFLKAFNCEAYVADLAWTVYPQLCASRKVIGGDDIIGTVFWSCMSPHLTAEDSAANAARIVESLKTIRYELNPDLYLPEVIQQDLERIFSDPPRADTGQLTTAKKLLQYYSAVLQPFMRHLHDRLALDWMAANFFALLVSDYFRDSVPEDKKPKELFVFSKKRIEHAMMRRSKSFFSLKSAPAFGMLNGIYWFADFLEQSGFIDGGRRNDVQTWCTELFEEVYDLLHTVNFDAKAFSRFPLVG